MPVGKRSNSSPGALLTIVGGLRQNGRGGSPGIEGRHAAYQLVGVIGLGGPTTRRKSQ